MKFYHGSMIKGLKELRPHLPVGAHIQEPLVYLTSSRQLALHYIWDTERLGVKMPMIHIREDGVFVFQEMFPTRWNTSIRVSRDIFTIVKATFR